MENLRRGVITAFVFLHALALIWWTTPGNGYPKDSRTAELPNWYTQFEKPLFAWKKASEETFLGHALERYVFATASWQSWWLFAPNPTDVHDWITVKAVLGWTDSNAKDKGPWGDSRKPIYDEQPIYASYQGDLKSRMSGFAGSYTHDSKLTENLASGKWDRPLASFAEYWGHAYQMRTGKKPIGVHVILTRGRIPEAFSGRAPASEKPTERVLWYFHY